MPLGPFLSPSLEDTGFPAQMEIYKALQGWMLGSKEGEAKTRDGETLVPFTAPCLESGRSLLSPSNFGTILW